MLGGDRSKLIVVISASKKKAVNCFKLFDTIVLRHRA